MIDSKSMSNVTLVRGKLFKKKFPVLFPTAFPINTLKYLYLLDPFRDHLFILMELNMNIIALSSYFGLGPAHKL